MSIKSFNGKEWVKPRLRKHGSGWECYLPTEHYSGRDLVGYGLTPKTAYIRFLKDCERSLWEQLSPWGKFKRWIKDSWGGNCEQ